MYIFCCPHKRRRNRLVDPILNTCWTYNTVHSAQYCMQTLLSIVFLCPLLCKMARQAKSTTSKRAEPHRLPKSNNLKTKLRINKQQQLANKARSVISLKRTVWRKQRCHHFLENNFGITLCSSRKLQQLKKCKKKKKNLVLGCFYVDVHADISVVKNLPFDPHWMARQVFFSKTINYYCLPRFALPLVTHSEHDLARKGKKTSRYISADSRDHTHDTRRHNLSLNNLK